MGNIAYIDNQNLFMATRFAPMPWTVDMQRFRVYLQEKYDVTIAYLFMGTFRDDLMDLYLSFQTYGYILVWRPHKRGEVTPKKSNVDTDVVFSMMRDLHEDAGYTGAVLVSGDGDYWRTVEYLNQNGKLTKVMLPSHKGASNLYKQLSDNKRVYLDGMDCRKKFGKRRRE